MVALEYQCQAYAHEYESERIYTALLGLSILAVAAGCGTSEPAAPARSLSSTMESIARSAGSLPHGLVAEGRLVTFGGAAVPGMLPPAQPVKLITKGNPDLKRVAMTIDDGWNADMRILDLLKSLEDQVDRVPHRRPWGRGIQPRFREAHPGLRRGGLQSHVHHYVMRGKDDATVLDEIWNSQEVITRVTHEVFPYIRFSGGAYDENSINWAAEQGFWVVNWSSSTNDTGSGVTLDSQVNAVLANLEPGAIILCHFGGHNTYEVLSRVIPEIQARGYEVTSLTRVLEGTPFVLEPSGGAGGEKASP